MKKEVLMLILGLCFYASLVSGAVLNVPSPYPTIQSAIDNASSGDTINVSAGTYVEDLIIDETKTNLELRGEDKIITTIKGISNVPVASLPLAIPNIEILADGVKIHGFTIEGPNYEIGKYVTGMVIDGTDIEIYDNNFVATKAENANELGQAILTYSKTAIPMADVSGLNIHDNSFTSSGIVGFEAIYINPHTGTGNIIIEDNEFSGSINIGVTVESGNVIVDNNTVNTNVDPESLPYGTYGIRFFDSTYSANYSNIVISNNNVQNFKRGIRVGNGGVGTTTIITDILFNTLINNKIGIWARQYGANINANYNDLFNNYDYGIKNDGTTQVNATYNWWGSCDGPSGIGSGTGDSVYGSVIYNPWIAKGICITNKTNVTCSFETKNVTLSADLNGTEINSVWFSYTINNTNYNKTASHIGGNKYQAVILSNESIGGQNITWNVYANDSIKTYKNGEKTFYVRKKTRLSVSPLNPDGDNGWYVTEPEFTLIKDNAGGNVYYQWDSDDIFLYTVPFGLENIPNPPEESAGTLELNWWTDFGGCGNETQQNKTFYIDLTNPLITNLKPANNSVVYNNLKPEISAYLDEVYGSNSGIDTEIVQMSLNGNPVPAIVNPTDTLDAIITYIPMSNLSLGNHNVSVNVTDNAGRNSKLTWFFYINITPVFTMQVNSPQSKIYDSKRIPFNITLSENVEKIEYINWDDRTPRWKNLCKDCNEYGFIREKTKTLNEGWDNLTIKATDYFGQVKEQNITFFIDSKKPKIHKTEPKRNSVVNGSEFYIKYTEDNLENITLFYGTGTEETTKYDCEAGKNQECIFSVDLISYDGQWIEYYFEVSDSINTVQSRKTRVFVDTISPVLTINIPEDFENYGRKVPFNIIISEKVLLEYIDNSASKPRWRRLTSNSDEYGSTRAKTISFSRGLHNILIKATDKAGNSDIIPISFNVDY